MVLIPSKWYQICQENFPKSACPLPTTACVRTGWGEAHITGKNSPNDPAAALACSQAWTSGDLYPSGPWEKQPQSHFMFQRSLKAAAGCLPPPDGLEVPPISKLDGRFGHDNVIIYAKCHETWGGMEKGFEPRDLTSGSSTA